MSIADLREMDRRFHTAISHASVNPPLVEVYAKVMARQFGSQETASSPADGADESEDGRIVLNSVAQHAALARAIANGDVATASTEGVAHLRAVECTLVDRPV